MYLRLGQSLAGDREHIFTDEVVRETRAAHARPTSCLPPMTTLTSPARRARTTERMVRARPRAFQPAFLRHQLSVHHFARSTAVDPGFGNGSGSGRRKAWKRKRLNFCSVRRPGSGRY